MRKFKKNLFPILLATLWISLSEFIRNEFLLRSYWIDHYSSLGLVFPSEPVNGMIWGIWSLCLAISIYFISRKFTLLETTFLSWFLAFVMMWLVIGNMDVLPLDILWFAIPLSWVEAFIAALIIKRMVKAKEK